MKTIWDLLAVPISIHEIVNNLMKRFEVGEKVS